MKTTIYELLGMIKDGKAPKKIIFESEEYVWHYVDKTYYCCDHDRTDLLNDYLITDILNKEVLILDNIENNIQDKIEKIDITDKSICVKGTRFFRDKDIEIFQKLSIVINEIIDRLNKDQL